jgi:hypothetical protein
MHATFMSEYQNERQDIIEGEEKECEGLHLNHLVQDMVQWRAFVNVK